MENLCQDVAGSWFERVTGDLIDERHLGPKLTERRVCRLPLRCEE
jgi:hypothetical protein